MEKTMSVEERIRRAEERYNQKNGYTAQMGNSRKELNIKNRLSEKKKTTKKLLMQIFVCLVIYVAFYSITNRDYIFSDNFKNDVNIFLKDKTKIYAMYENSKEFVNSKILHQNEKENNEVNNVNEQVIDDTNNIEEQQIENTSEQQELQSENIGGANESREQTDPTKTDNTENVEKEIQITTSTQEESQISSEKKTEIIEETGKQGDSDLYEIQEGEDNIKIATIKSSVKYKVAFAGMIKNRVPEKEELDDVLEENHPKYAGIWIKSESQSEFLKYISSVTKSEYEINEKGYLKIKNKKKQNNYDKKIEEIINGNKLYIIDISSTCYIVDEITGEILDYNFEDMDEYQTYQYFEDGDKKIIFITENQNNQLTVKEIIESVIELL